MSQLFKAKSSPKNVNDVKKIEHEFVEKEFEYHEKVINAIRENGNKIDNILRDLRNSDV